MPAMWLPGQVVHGLYDVLEVIGSGGMGLVYRVRHREWRIDLAVKVPRPELVGSPRAMHNFESEAELWVGLGLHPHTVNCVYVRRMDGVPWVFAEWADGGNLAEAVRTRRVHRQGLAGLLDIAIQSAWGLAHAHASGLVHQDVKPANVLLSADGTAKVTDFGLARARFAAGERPADSGLVSCGGLTPAYCSPEQARAAAGHQVGLTRATDVWSWGVTVLELFAGGPPVKHGADAAVALDQIVHSGELAPEIPVLPRELASLLGRCFEADPDARPPGMSELAGELIDLYVRLTGEPYPRQAPSAVRLLADGLSNQALSMLDLGLPDQAEELWSKALRADPHHPHTVYNRGLHHWRAGRLSDARLVERLDEMRASHEADWVDEFLLGLVHVERGDRDQALPLLAEVAAKSPEASSALETARELPPGRPPLVLADDHATNVETGALSADGRVGASGAGSSSASEGGSVRVWDLDSGRLRCLLPAHPRRVHTVALSADGSIVASCGDEPDILVWDAVNGRPLHRLRGHVAEVWSIAVSPDGRLLTSAAADGAVLVWALGDGRVVRSLQRPHLPGSAYEISVAMDADRVVRWEGEQQDRYRVWELGTGHLVRSVRLPRRRAVLSPGGRFALTTCDEKVATAHAGTELYTVVMELWDTAGGQRVHRFELDGTYRSSRATAVSGDGRRAVVAGPSGLQLWDLAEGRCIRTEPGYDRELALDAGGRRVFFAGRCQVWEVPGPGPRAPWSYSRPRSAMQHSREANVVDRALDRAGAFVLSGQWRRAAGEVRAALRMPGYESDPDLLDQWARIGRHGRRRGLLSAWQAWELTLDHVPEYASMVGSTDRQFSVGPAVSFSLSRDGRFFLGKGLVWDLRTGQIRRRLSAHGPEMRGMVLSPDGSTVVAGCGDRQIRVWDVASGELRHLLAGHPGEVDAVSLSTDGRVLVTGCREGTVRIWDLADGTCLRHLTGHPDFAVEVALSPDTRFAFAVGFDHAVSVWDVAEGRYLHVLPGGLRHVVSTAVSVDSRTVLAIGHGSKLLFAVDPRTQEPRGVLPGHRPAEVTSLAVSADGRFARTAGADGTVRVWDIAGDIRSSPVHTLSGHRGSVTMLAPCAEDRFTLSCGADGTVRVWDLVAGTCLRTLSGHNGAVVWLGVSGDARTAVSVGKDNTARVWRLEWDFEFPEPADWNEKARPYVDAFRARREWLGDDFQHLLDTLADAGLGWLDPGGVRRKAE